MSPSYYIIIPDASVWAQCKYRELIECFKVRLAAKEILNQGRFYIIKLDGRKGVSWLGILGKKKKKRQDQGNKTKGIAGRLRSGLRVEPTLTDTNVKAREFDCQHGLFSAAEAVLISTFRDVIQRAREAGSYLITQVFQELKQSFLDWLMNYITHLTYIY